MDDFGLSLTRINDQNGDRKDEIVANDSDTEGGIIRIYYSNAGGYSLNTSLQNWYQYYGRSLKNFPDLNNDGKEEIIFNDPTDDDSVVIYTSKTGTWAELKHFTPPIGNFSSLDDFGYSIAVLKDFNYDGFADILIGALGGQSDGLSKNGSAIVIPSSY